MMSHVCVRQANACRVPNVVKNARQTENELDSHHYISWAFDCQFEELLVGNDTNLA